MRTLRIALWIVVALSAAANSASADFGPPISMGLVGEPRVARSGELYAGTLFIESAVDAELSSLRIDGPGWRSVSTKAPALLAVGKGERVFVDFVALPTDPDRPLTVSVDWNGRTYTKDLDLSEANVRRARQGGRMHRSPAGGVMPNDAWDRGASRPEPYVGRLPESFWQDRRAALDDEHWESAEDEEALAKASYDIRVSGRWTYWRSDNFHIGADAITIEIYDFDVMSPPDLLAATLTSNHGFFDVTFHWDSIDTPDLFVVIWAANSKTQVEHDTWPHLVRSWSSDVMHNYGGTHWDIGTCEPPEADYPAVHIHNGITRTWRWFNDLGYDCRSVEVWWPEGDNASYSKDHDRIKISAAAQWREGTQSHEYGHHWMNCFASIPDPDYCNGFCDEGDDCGHCLWCRENEHDAWQEGFADYIGYTVPGTYQEEYANWALSRTQVGGLDTCWVDLVIHDPLITEGFIASAMADIHDPVDPGDDHAIFPGYADQLGMGSEEILSCVDLTNPSSPMDFLLEFKSRNPGVVVDLWETAMNCGYDIDEEDPSLVSSLSSLTHEVGVESPSAQIWMAWTRATDDASGVEGYSYSFTQGGPSSPDTIRDLGNMTVVSSGSLEAGAWYFNIRSVDRAGNWDGSYAWRGPYLIRDPEPADVAKEQRADWDYELVPEHLAVHTWTTAHVSATLPGWELGTRYSVSGRNIGEMPTSEPIRGALWVDGEYRHDYDWSVIPGESSFATINQGPIEVAGGRHAMYFKFDSNDRIAEPSESNNYTGRQFVWTPMELTPGTVVTNPPAPEWDAGWDHLDHGVTLFFNSHGMRMTSNGWWNAVVMWGTDPGDNYDLRLHEDSAGAEDGFAGILRHSGRGAGCIDALILNRNNVGSQDWDVGVVNLWRDGDHDYRVVHLATPDNPWYVDDVYTVELDTEEYLAVQELYVGSAFVGPVSLFVSTEPPTSPLYVQWRDEDYGYGRLLEADLEMVTDTAGELHMQLDIPETGYHGLVFYRDPKDGSDPVTITVDIKSTPPDMTPYHAAGWHSPMVPRAADDGTPTSVPLPTVLQGNQTATYYNLALCNASDGDAVNVPAAVYLDGVSDGTLSYSSFPAWATSRFNWGTPHLVRGGRHTLSLWIDAPASVEEIHEDNNAYGEQYIWTPLLMTAGTYTQRDAPPSRTGGWTQVESGEPKWYNCDGLGIKSKGLTWGGMAAMPSATGNVDLRLHEHSTGAKDGFAQNHALSAWGVGQSDFVVVNYRLTPLRDMDVGVLRLTGVDDYVAEAAGSTVFPEVPGTTGSVAMDAGHMLDLYQVPLPVGSYRFTLKPRLFDEVDWGMTLHPDDEPYFTKSMIVSGAAAWLNEAGRGEAFDVTIQESGQYCLAVWKVGSDDLALDGDYSVTITQVATGVEDGPPPLRTGITALYPNPFNPRVSIAFELAQAGPVEVVVYNAAGARVRTLLREPMTVGRHELSWDGVDDLGHRVASGVYLLRLGAGSLQQTKKMVLLK